MNAAPAPASTSVMFQDPLGERRHIADASGADTLELLCLRSDLTSVPSFEFALRERVSRLANFRHAYYGRVRSVDRLNDGSTLAVVSDRVPGVRLSELLDVAEQRRVTLDINTALSLIRQLVPAVALLHEHARDVAHGALGAERLVVTPNARLVIVEHVLGAALEQLRFSQERYWNELRIPVPRSTGLPRFDHRADVLQLGVVALSLVLGRPLKLDEYPSMIGDVVASAWAISARGGLEPLPSGLRAWLARALQLDPRNSFPTAVEARADLDRTFGDSDYIVAPHALEEFLAQYHDLRVLSEPAAAKAEEPKAEKVRPVLPAVEPPTVPLIVEPPKASTVSIPARVEAPVIQSLADSTGISRPVFESLRPEKFEAPRPEKYEPLPEKNEPLFDKDEPLLDEYEPLPEKYEPPQPERAFDAPVFERSIVEPAARSVVPAPIPPFDRPIVEPPRAARFAEPRGLEQGIVEPPRIATPIETPVFERSIFEPLKPEEPPALERFAPEATQSYAPFGGGFERVEPSVTELSSFVEEDSEEGDEMHRRRSAPRWPRLAAVAAVLGALVVGGVFAGRRYFVATASVPATGGLVMATDPPGAQVSVDGVLQGVTPISLTLKTGPHVIELRAGSDTRSIPITIASGIQASQYIELSKAGPPTGQLQVRTEPGGAQVSVDGVLRGKAPLTVGDLAPGTHTVVLENEAGSIKQEVTIDAGATASLVVPLAVPAGAAASGWVSVTAPVTMQLYENGRLLGSTETERIMVPAGRHEIEITNQPLAFRVVQNIQVAPGRVALVKLDLPSQKIAINAVPWAEVWIDGNKIGETPIGDLSVTVGPHEVVFRHPQLGEQRHALTVTAAAPARLSVDMRKP